MTDKTATHNLLAQLTAAGAMASDDVTSHEVAIGDGTATVFVHELSDKRFRKILTKVGGYDRADLIAAAIADESGKAVFTAEQAGNLKPKMAKLLEEVAMKANGFDAKAAEEVGND